MKIKTILVVAVAAGAGYVLGTRAGRAKFDELKARASESPIPRSSGGRLKGRRPGQQNAGKLPDPLADAVTSVADSVQHKQ